MLSKIETLRDLLIEQLEDIYDAEQRLANAIPTMIEHARDPQLQAALREHRQETHTHIARLDECFEQLGTAVKTKTSQAMRGLLGEIDDLLSDSDDDIRDTALIAQLQRIEHYEIASYSAIAALADNTGNPSIADLLEQTLVQEQEMNRTLSTLAETVIDNYTRRTGISAGQPGTRAPADAA